MAKVGKDSASDDQGIANSITTETFDLALYRRAGVQVVKAFFEPELKERFKALGAKIGEEARLGRLVRSFQVAEGIDLDAEARPSDSPALWAVAKELLGDEIAQFYIRVLMKDRTFKSAIAAHQDWPYFSGDTRKLNVFIPLTPCGSHNGMIKFYTGSHAMGPLERGEIDIDRFPQFTPAVPELEVGDVLFADFLTWHSSVPSETDDDRILIQLTLQPMADPSSSVVFGRGWAKPPAMPRRSFAMLTAVPSVGSTVANEVLKAGDADEAARLAGGLRSDSVLNVEARLMLAEITRRRDGDYWGYLNEAEDSLVELSKLVDQALGRPSRVTSDLSASIDDIRAELGASLKKGEQTSLELETALKALDDRTADLKVHTSALDEVRQKLDAAEMALQAQSVALSTTQKALDEAVTSSSWKLTAPLRTIASRIGRKK